MRIPRLSPRPGQAWWWIFGLFIAAPAMALALLGLRAARVERIERQQQLRERQVQIARLADAALTTALNRLEGELAQAANASREPMETAPRDVYLFSLDRQGLVLFPRDR